MAVRPLAVAAVYALLASGVPARAATFTVTSQDDAADALPGDGVCATLVGVCTLRAAVEETNAVAGEDAVAVPAGTFTLALAGPREDLAATGDLDVRDALTITGSGSAATILDAAMLDRLFDVPVAVALTVTDLTIRNGQASAGFPLDPGGGAYVRDGASLTLVRVALEDNRPVGDGGGVAVGKDGSLTLADVSFARNVAEASGAIALPSGGSLTAERVSFEQNAQNAVWAVDTNAILSGVRFVDNRNAGLVNSGGTMLVTDAVFADNDSGAALR
jgi:hypothetical protein